MAESERSPNASATPSERPIDRLLQVMARLRDPEKGCPWDLRQDFHTLIPYLIEECYETVDAIERGDFEHLKEELGDLLLQVVFHCQIAKERGLFDFDQVAEEITEKLIRRHPHVFEGVELESDEARQALWEKIKAEERARKGRGEGGAFEGILEKFPALLAALKLQERAAKLGLDWPAPEPVFEKLSEELRELEEAWRRREREAVEEEVGDLLFAAVNLARKLGVDPERALRRSCRKFKERALRIEALLEKEGKRPEEVSPEELDRLWEESKKG